MEKALACPLCHNVFTDPHVISVKTCKHTYCLFCIRRHFERRKGAAAAVPTVCPQCRARCSERDLVPDTAKAAAVAIHHAARAAAAAAATTLYQQHQQPPNKQQRQGGPSQPVSKAAAAAAAAAAAVTMTPTMYTTVTTTTAAAATTTTTATASSVTFAEPALAAALSGTVVDAPASAPVTVPLRPGSPASSVDTNNSATSSRRYDRYLAAT